MSSSNGRVERVWYEYPYRAEDREKFPEFESELKDHLEAETGIKALLWHANNRRDIEALHMISRVERYDEHDAINVDSLETPTTPGESASEGYKPSEATPLVTKRSKKKKKTNDGGTDLLLQFVSSETSMKELVIDDCKKIAVYFAKMTRMMTADKLKRFCQIDQMKQLIREQRVEL